VSERMREKGLPSVLGFYKENHGPEKLIVPICGDSLGLYVEVPTHLHNCLEVVVESHGQPESPTSLGKEINVFVDRLMNRFPWPPALI